MWLGNKLKYIKDVRESTARILSVNDKYLVKYPESKFYLINRLSDLEYLEKKTKDLKQTVDYVMFNKFVLDIVGYITKHEYTMEFINFITDCRSDVKKLRG